MKVSSDPALFKVLGHPERYAILRCLMANRATLTQLGEFFHKTPAHVRHHLIRLEREGLVEFVEARTVQGGPEKYYQATQRALFIHHAVLPEDPERNTSITIGSMDSGVKHLAALLAEKQAPFILFPIALSSLDGLIALRQGLCEMSTCHLVDFQTEEYNRPFIRHLFPGQTIALLLLYRREEGLLVKSGNPLGIRSLEDLARPKVRFVNREPGSGVRQWLDFRLNKLGIQADRVAGYRRVANSHSAVAEAVRGGIADVGIGIVAAAREFGLDFLPLFEEPYEIAVPTSFVSDKRYAAFFEFLNSGETRNSIRDLSGYTVPQNSGTIEVIC